MSQEVDPQVQEAGLNYLRRQAAEQGDLQLAPEANTAAERFEGIGEKAVQRYQQVAGVIVPVEEVQKMRESGQDVGIHATAGRQS